MKIGLIVCVDDVIEKTQMFGVKYMPVWAYTLSAYLKNIPDLEVFLYDTRIKSKIQTPQADVYLISGINQDYNSLCDYLHLLRNNFPKAKVILGGPITSSYQMAGKIKELYLFDHLFLGDGEIAITQLVEDLIANKNLPKMIENKNKFPLINARAMDEKLIQETHTSYYGGVVEVSRGCPFLCEFCDIRTKPDNNSANNKKASVIIEELEIFAKLGIKNILFACDNFIGSPTWAEALCDEIIEWKKVRSTQVNLYTWLTINIVYHPRLLKKMKLAGFDMFFIGVESFGVEQLLETAKLQNVKTDIVESIRTIQSYGFIVVAGLIFGFDSDPEDSIHVALKGIRESGLISGDPSLLTALPGTPLYRRMELSGRLRNGKLGLGGKKYVTNIKYLRNDKTMIKDFISFVHEFNQPAYQFERYKSFIHCLAENSVTTADSNYINVASLFKLVSQNPVSIFSVVKRFLGVVNSPSKIQHVGQALLLTLTHPYARLSFFYFWLFNWSNSILKYGNLNSSEFDIDSLHRPVILTDIIPETYETDYFEPIPLAKIKAQRQATIKALTATFEAR
jgi:radical SAM superfamily enzyme YgiQ (UPF0313 family)